MRVTIGFFFSLVWAFAESTYQTPLAAYLGLTAAQSDALERGYEDFNDFAAARQARLDQVRTAISYARAASYPDLADIGRLYLECEVILRDAVAHADAWHSTAVAILTVPQVAKLENVRRAYDLYGLIYSAQAANLIGPTDGGIIATPLFGRSDISPALNPYEAYQLQAYLGLSDTQIRALIDILNPELNKATDIYLRILDSDGKARLELTKDAPDPITIGQLITAMDATAAAQPTAGLAQLREAELAQLTPAQRKLLAQMDEWSKVVNLVHPATCLALVAPQLSRTTVTASGAIAFNLNQLPRLDFGCDSY